VPATIAPSAFAHPIMPKSPDTCADRPAQVSWAFWPLALLAALAALGIARNWWPANAPWLLRSAIAVMLLGGLPHGACDLTLAAQSWQTGPRQLALVLAAYLAVAAAMAALWFVAPLAALILFLALAGLHFGEDWQMLPSALLRLMAGLAVLACAAAGQGPTVAALFAALTHSPHALLATQALAALAPVTLLVTSVGLAMAWRSGHRHWVIAQALSYIALLTLPPLLGFTLFFVGLHSPLHWRAIAAQLPPAIARHARREGLWFSALSLVLWALFLLWQPATATTPVSNLAPLQLGAEAFRLLSILAAPHLALSLAIAARLQSAQQP